MSDTSLGVLVVRKVMGLALVQDRGRAGFAAQGVPRGGALVRDALARANLEVGNDAGAAAIEIFGGLVVAATTSDVILATERGDRRVLHAGDELAVEPDASRRVRYLAVAGGVDVPVVLGSRSTLAAAGLGGFEGRPLRAGDGLAVRIAAAASPSPPSGVSAATPHDAASPEPILVIAGPDMAVFGGSEALESLTGQVWRIDPASDRSGTRLSGRATPRASADLLPSSPMVPGAIQLPAGGLPIVLGPDGPTTGGYPLLAVIRDADLDRFHTLPLGASVRFAHAPSP